MNRPFASRIRRLRHRLGWSREALAACLFVSWQTISRWETGKTTPHGYLARRVEELEQETKEVKT